MEGASFREVMARGVLVIGWAAAAAHTRLQRPSPGAHHGHASWTWPS